MALLKLRATPVPSNTTPESAGVSQSPTPRPVLPSLVQIDCSHDNSLPPSSPPPPTPPISPAKSILSEHEISLSGHDTVENLVLRTVKVEDGYCAGQWLKWEAGSVFGTYPYQQHTNNGLPWTPIGFKENWILLRALACTEILESGRENDRLTCDACYDLLNSQRLLRVVNRATEGAAPRTPWQYLSAIQLQQLLVIERERNRKLTLNVCPSLVFGHRFYNALTYSDIQFPTQDTASPEEDYRSQAHYYASVQKQDCWCLAYTGRGPSK